VLWSVISCHDRACYEGGPELSSRTGGSFDAGNERAQQQCELGRGNVRKHVFYIESEVSAKCARGRWHDGGKKKGIIVRKRCCGEHGSTKAPNQGNIHPSTHSDRPPLHDTHQSNCHAVRVCACHAMAASQPPNPPPLAAPHPPLQSIFHRLLAPRQYFRHPHVWPQ